MALVTQTVEGDVYEVFARFGPEEPLHHIGTVIADNPELASLYAYTLYDEWGWREMVIVPRRDMITLVEVA